MVFRKFSLVFFVALISIMTWGATANAQLIAFFRFDRALINATTCDNCDAGSDCDVYGYMTIDGGGGFSELCLPKVTTCDYNSGLLIQAVLNDQSTTNFGVWLFDDDADAEDKIANHYVSNLAQTKDMTLQSVNNNGTWGTNYCSHTSLEGSAQSGVSVTYKMWYADTTDPGTPNAPTFSGTETQISSQYYDSDTTLNVTWTGGEDANSGETNSLIVRELPSTDTTTPSWTSCNPASKTLSVCGSSCNIASTVRNGYAYQIRVVSKNGCNPSTDTKTTAESAWSDSVRIDTQSPAVALTGAPGSWISGNATLTATCDDSPTGGPDCSFCAGDPDCGNIVPGCFSSGCDSTTYKFKSYTSNPGACSSTYTDYTIASPASFNSHVWVCSAAKDKLNKKGYSTPVEVKVDNTAPTTGISGTPASWQNTTATANVTCSDSESGCDAATKMLKTYTSNPGTCSTTYADYTLANNSTINSHVWVCGTVKDNVGNAGFSSPVEYQIDMTIPTATVSGTPSSWQKTDATANVTCLDTGDAGCDNTTYRVKTYNSDPGVCPTSTGVYTTTVAATISSHQWLCAMAADKAGNYGYSNPTEVPVEFLVDQTAPTTTITGAPAGWQNTNATANVTCSDTGGSTCDPATKMIKSHTTNPGTCSTTYTEYTLPNASTINSHVWLCSAVKDVATNKGYSTPYEFKVDKTSPVLGTPEIFTTTTYYGSYYSGSTVDIRATVTDAGGSTLDTTTCKYSIDNGSSWLAASWDGTYCYKLGASVAGTINVMFKMKDIATNLGTSAASTFSQDSNAPTVSIAGAPASWQNTNATAVLSCTDTEAGCDTSTYRIISYTSDPGVCPPSWASYGGVTTPSLTVSANLWICAAAKDRVNNMNYTSAPTEFKVDKTAPSASLTGAPGSWQNTDATAVSSCASDTGGSGCDTASYKIKTYTTNPGTCSTTYTDYTLSTPQTVSAHLWVCAGVKDIAGNLTVSSPVEFMVDKTLPTVSTPQAYSANIYGNFYSGSSTDLRAAANDGTDSGVNTSSCTFSINNGTSFSPALWDGTNCYQVNVASTGQIVVKFRVDDMAGNQGNSTATTYTQDNAAPTSSVTALGQYVNTNPFTVNWTGADGTGAGVKNYDIQYKAGAGAWTDWLADNTSVSGSFNGTDGQTYYFQSRAEDNLGNLETYPGGNGDTVTTLDITAPSSQVAALGAFQSSNSFTVSWSGTDTPGGSGVKNYDIQYKDGVAGAWTDWLTDTTLTSSTFNGTDGHSYYFQSRAEDIAGNVEAYPGGNGDTGTSADTAPPTSSVTALPSHTGVTAFTVSWTGSDLISGVKNYDIQYRDGSSGAWTDLITDTITTSYSFTGTAEHTYYFQSRAEDNLGNVEAYPGGDGDTSITIDQTAPSSTISALSGYQTSTSFSVSWSGTDNSAGIATYDIQYRDGAMGFWTNWQLATALTTATFNGTEGHTYYFQSRAKDSVNNLEAYEGGDGDYFTTVDSIAPTSSVAPLSANQANESFTVTWSGTDATSGINTYDVQVKDGAAGVWTNWLTATTLTSSSYSGVDGHTYYFQSRAKDHAGNTESYPGGAGDTSTTVNTSILPAPATISDGAGADEDYTVSTTTLAANWTAVTNAAKYYYAIGTTQSAQDVVGWTDNGAATSFSVNTLTLTNGQIYYIFVKPENPAGIEGQSGYSDGITVDTSAPTAQVATLAAYQGTANFTVGWSASDSGSGVKNYDVQYKDGAAGVWTAWLTGTTSTSDTFNGTTGHTYYFQCRATDNLDNVGTYPGGDGDTSTIVDTTVLPAPSFVYDGTDTGADSDYNTSSATYPGNWNSVTNAVSYQYGIGTTNTSPNVTGWLDNGTSTSVTASGLSLAENNTYYLFARAINVAGVLGTTGVSDGASIDTSAPTSAVISLAAFQGAANFNVSWSGTDGSGAGLKDFDIQYRDGDNGAWTDWLTDTALTTSSFTGVNGHKYYFRSRAVDNLDQLEDWPADTGGDTFTTVDTQAPTSQITALNSYQNSGSFLVQWSGDDGTGFSGIASYDIQYKEGATGTWTNWLTGFALTEAAFTLGIDKETYYFQVRAADAVGNTEAYPGGNGDSSTTVDTVAPVSSVATLSEYQAVANFTVSWSGSDTDGSGVSRYDVQYKEVSGGGSVWTAVWKDWLTDSTLTSSTFTGTNGYKYYFQVRAKDAAGNAEAWPGGDGDTFTTVDTSKLAAPSSIRDGSSSDIDFTTSLDTLSANWTQVSGASKYYYGLGDSTSGPNIVSWTDNADSTSATINGLSMQDGDTFYFFVKAENFSGIQGIIGYSDGVTVDITNPVCSVNALSEYLPTETFTVSWTGSDSGSGIKNYDIKFRDGATAAWQNWLAATAVTSADFTGADTHSYYFECRATDNMDNSESFTGADEAHTSIDTTIPQAPASVNDGTGDDEDYTTVTTRLSANWSTAENAAKYLYQITTGGGAEVVPWTDNGTAASVTHTGLALEPGTKYVFIVKAQNKAGIDGPSAQSDGCTPDTTGPSTPQVADVGESTNDPETIEATWSSEDPHTPIVEYQYAIGTTPGGEDVAPFTSANVATSISHGNLSLIDGQSYFITVKAKNAAGLWSETGVSDGVTYRLAYVNVDIQAFPQVIEIAPDEQVDVTYRFTISGNSDLSLEREKVTLSLSSRDIEMPEESVSFNVSLGTPQKELKRTMKFDEATVLEALAGGQTAQIAVRREFIGRDKENNEITIRHSLPVTIQTAPSVTNVLEIRDATLSLAERVEMDSITKPILDVTSTGVSGRVRGRIIINDTDITNMNFIASGGGRTDVLELPPLYTYEEGDNTIRVVIDSPNHVETTTLNYEIYIPELPYAVEELNVTSDRNSVLRDDLLTGRISMLLSGDGGLVKGAAYSNGNEWQNFEVDLQGGEEVSFDSPPLPTSNEGDMEFSVKLRYPDKIESTLEYKVLSPTAALPATLSTPHPRVAYIRVKDDGGNVLVNYRQVESGIAVWSKDSNPVQVMIPSLGIANPVPVMIAEKDALTFSQQGAAWVMADGAIEIHNPLPTSFRIIGATELEKAPGQSAPLVTINKDGLAIDGIGKIGGQEIIKFNGLTIMANSPEKIVMGDAVIDASDLYLNVTMEYEEAPLLFSLTTEPALSDSVLMSSSIKLSGQLVMDKDGLHFPDGENPAEFVYSYGEYKVPESIKGEFLDGFTLDQYPVDPERLILSGRLELISESGRELAAMDRPQGFTLAPQFWGDIVGASIPDVLPLPDEEIMYVRLRDSEGNPLVDVDVREKDSFSKALRVFIWSKDGKKLDLYIPALRIDEDSTDDSDTALPLTIPEGSPLELTCSPDCSEPENWRVVAGDLEVSSLPEIPYAGVTLDIDKLRFDPVMKKVGISGSAGFKLGEENSSYDVPFSEVPLSKAGIATAITITPGMMPDAFTYDGAKLAVDEAMLYFENTSGDQFFTAWSEAAEERISALETRKEGVASKIRELGNKKSLLDEKASGMRSEKSLLDALAASNDTQAVVAQERIISLEKQLAMIDSEISRIDSTINSSNQLAASMDTEIQELQAGVSGASSMQSGGGMAVAYLLDMKGKVKALPMFGDISSSPVTFNSFYILFDPADGYKPKITGAITLGDNGWYSANASRVFQQKLPPVGDPLFETKMWGGKLDFSIHYAMLMLNNGKMADAGFSGGISFDPGGGAGTVNTVINVAYDPYTGQITGNSMLPAIDLITFAGMNLSIIEGFSDVSYSMMDQSTHIEFFGITGYMNSMPAPIGTLTVPVEFSSARITESGFSVILSNLSSNLALKSFPLLDSGDDKVRLDLHSVNIEFTDNVLTRGVLSAVVNWYRNNENHRFAGLLDYAENGSISGEISGIELPVFYVDDLLGIHIEGGKVVFAASASGNTFSVVGLEGSISRFPLFDEYDPAGSPVPFDGCTWTDDGFSCDILHNSAPGCSFSGGGELFSRSFYNAEDNPDYAMMLGMTGVCATVEDGHISEFKARGNARLKHRSAQGSLNEIYKKDVVLTLEDINDDPVMKGSRSDVAIGKYSHRAMQLEVTSGDLFFEIYRDDSTAELNNLSGKILALPDMPSLASNPIDFDGFAISEYGFSGMIEPASPITRQATLFGATVNMEMSKLRFSPAAFAVNGIVSIPLSSKSTMPDTVRDKIENSCYPLELNVSSMGFLYDAPLDIYYGQFSETLPCGADFAMSPDGFAAGTILSIPPIPMPDMKQAYLQIKEELVFEKDSDQYSAPLQDVDMEMHLTFLDNNYPSNAADAAAYNDSHPGSHRTVAVEATGDVSVVCELDTNRNPVNCHIVTSGSDATIAGTISPELRIEREDYRIDATELSYGNGDACGTSREHLLFNSALRELPGLGAIGSIDFDSLYLVSDGLCGELEIDPPERTIDGYGFDISSGVLEITASSSGQVFRVRDIEGDLTDTPGFDLSLLMPTFTGVIEGDQYEFVFDIIEETSSPNEVSIGGLGLSLDRYFATITPDSTRMSIAATMSLPPELQYVSGTISATAWVELDNVTAEPTFGISAFEVTDAVLEAIGVAKLTIERAHYEEDPDGNYFEIDSATLAVTFDEITRDVTIIGLRIYSDHIEADEIDIDETIDLEIFRMTLGKIAFVRPDVGLKYVTFTGGAAIDLGGTGVEISIPNLDNFKVFEDFTVSLSALSFSVDTPPFSLAGTFYFSDFPNDQQIQIIKPACAACESVFSEEIYLQDTDDKKDFLGSVMLEIKGLFSLETTISFLSNNSFGIYLATTLPPPGITPAPPVPVSIVGVFGGIMYRAEPAMFALSFGGDVSITGFDSVIKGKAGFTAVFGEPTLFNLCAGLQFGKVGSAYVCDVSGSATVYFTGYKGFLGTLVAECQFPPNNGFIFDANLTANICLRETGGCSVTHPLEITTTTYSGASSTTTTSTPTDLVAECFTGTREEYFNFRGSASVLNGWLQSDIGGAVSEDGFDGGVKVYVEGEFLDPDIVGVWYYLDGQAYMCKVGKTGMWGRADIAGGAGVSVIGIDLATIDIAGTLSFYTSPWKFSGAIGGGACIGISCGRTVCEGCIGDCCPHNPGAIRSSACGTEGCCFNTKLIRTVGAISTQFTIEP